VKMQDITESIRRDLPFILTALNRQVPAHIRKPQMGTTPEDRIRIAERLARAIAPEIRAIGIDVDE
jgi:hypothetical protein